MVDHAYISRLERSEKIAPSIEVVESLTRALGLSPSRAKLLRLLIGKKVNANLVDVFVDDESRPMELLGLLAQMNFCGKQPKTHKDWRIKADKLLDFLRDD
tara:strand:- start:177 stop:479 length:303 start_codon:yes stop_codon:yes gene_type:complete